MIEIMGGLMRFFYSRPILTAFSICLLMMTFFFWGTLLSTPHIASGDAFIARDELVPIFDWKNQFIDQIVGGDTDLTYSNEVRLSYSFWTAWTRYTTLLPLMLVLLNTLSIFILFLSVYILLKSLFKPKTAKSTFIIMLASLLGAIPIFIIILYAKITTFYTLIFGFSLFSLATSLTVKDLILERTMSIKKACLVAALVLFNPTIHFHVLYYLLIVLIGTPIVLHKLIKRRFSSLWENIKYLLTVIILSGIPYAALILLTLSLSEGDISNQIPLNYWGIYYNSLSLHHLLGFNTTAQADVELYGSYIIPLPRLSPILLMALIILGLLISIKKSIPKKITKFMLIFTSFLLISLFMSVGYSSDSLYGFHHLVGDITNGFNSLGFIGEAVNKIIYAFLNILRYPHRFQFIQFYAAACLIAATIVLIVFSYRSINKRLTLTALALLVSISILGDNDYRNSFLTGRGTMNGYLAAYEIPEELKEIKLLLQESDNTKLFIIPSLESSRSLTANDHSYTFIDKALIYYLNTPTYYYGAGSDVKNKVMSERVYRGISADSGWWDEVLSTNLGITHILVPKQTSPNIRQVQYFPQLEQDLRLALNKSDRYRLLVNGDDFSLYERRAAAKQADKEYLVDLPDEMIDDFYNSKLNASKAYYPVQYDSASLGDREEILLYTDNISRASYTIKSSIYPEKVFYPDQARLPYRSDIVESSVFTTTGPSLEVLNQKNHQYNLFENSIPSMSSLIRPTFIGTRKEAAEAVQVHLTIPYEDKYTVLLHAYSSENSLEVRFNGRLHLAQRISGSNLNGDSFNYYEIEANLKKGQYTYGVLPSSNNPIVVNSVYVESVQESNELEAESLAPQTFLVKLAK